MQDHHERLKLLSNKAWAKNQSNDTKGKNLPNHWGEVDAPLQCFGMEIDSLKKDDGVVNTIWWSVGLTKEHGWRNGHEKRPNEKYGRDKTEVWEIELFNLPMVLPKEVQELVVVPQIQYICSLWWKDKFPQYRVFRNCRGSEKRSTTIRWSMSFLWCRGFVPPSKKKKKTWLNPPERLVKNQIACVARIVLCELRLRRKPRSVSSHLHYLLFSPICFWQMSFPAFFTISHHVLKTFSNVLLSSFENAFFQTILTSWQKHSFVLSGRILVSIFLFWNFLISLVSIFWSFFDSSVFWKTWSLSNFFGFFHSSNFFHLFFVWSYLFLICSFLNSFLYLHFL